MADATLGPYPGALDLDDYLALIVDTTVPGGTPASLKASMNPSTPYLTLLAFQAQ